jgi:hypothetical protein
VTTPICERLGIEFPIFAFSHCRDVVAAVSRAGGYGVLGALAFSPDQLDMELTWIDENVGGKPYGVDIVMPAKYVGQGDGPAANLDKLHELIPQEHRDFVEQLLKEHDVPPLPPGADHHNIVAAGLNVEEDGKGHVEVSLAHKASMLVNALGPPPPEVIAQAHEHGLLVGALIGSRQHAERQVAQGVDVIVAQGTEAGGHTGDVATMVLVPEVVDAVGDKATVLAAGGIGSGRQMAAATRPRRPGRVDRFDLAHRGRGQHRPGRDGQAARRDLPRHRAVALVVGQAGPPAAHRLDRGLGQPRHARPAADAAPGHRPHGSVPPGEPGRQRRAARLPGRPDRGSNGPGPLGARGCSGHGRRVDRHHPAPVRSDRREMIV